MAVRQVDPNKTLTAWNNKIFFPKDSYILRCIGEEVGPNNNDNMMVTLEWEIVNQKPIQVGDKMVDFDGVKFKSYHVTRMPDDEQKSENMFQQYQERVLVPCGVDVSQGWDDENPPSVKGKVVYATVYGKENPSYKSPTPEEKAQGKKVGGIIKDPITGKDVILYQPNIETIFGLYQGEVSRPF